MKSSTSIAKHTLPPPPELIECDTVLDIGAGIRPMQWYVPDNFLICVEPHDAYANILVHAGYTVVRQTAIVALQSAMVCEAVYLLDVLEHMDKNEGLEVIELAKEKAKKQVIIFTPKGFTEQTEDVWNLGGEYWQTHRSGWLPGEFPGWAISYFDTGFFAVWTHTHN